MIPAFVKRKDALFYDGAISFSPATGVRLSRARAVSFDHNNMKDLEMKLEEITAAERHLAPAQRSRPYVLVEGLYSHTADLPPLAELLQLRARWPPTYSTYSTGVLNLLRSKCSDSKFYLNTFGGSSSILYHFL